MVSRRFCISRVTAKAEPAIVIGSPCVVPSFDKIYVPPIMNKRAAALQQLLLYVDIIGYKTKILCSIAFLFTALNAFWASISKTVSVVWSLYMSWIACIAASAPAFYLAQTCNESAAFLTSCLLNIITTFFDIFLNTSPTQINLNPRFLLRSTKCY